MPDPQRIDVYGLSVKGSDHDVNHDHFATATLNKSLRLHQSNLSIDDESRLHGDNQGHLFLVAGGLRENPSSRATGTAIDSVVKYFLNEMPWYHLADGSPEDVILALEDALKNAREELARDLPAVEHGLGTDLSLALVFWPDLYIAHTGESHCYLGRNGRLRQLTTESSEVRRFELEPRDRLGLLTEGVTREQPRGELEEDIIESATARGACERLLAGESSDDRTAVVVRFVPLETVRARNGLAPPRDGLTAVRKPGAPRRRQGPSPRRSWNEGRGPALKPVEIAKIAQ